MMIFPRKNFRKLLCLTASTLISILLCGTAAAETIYKTVDAQGNVSFSNTPPPEGVEAQQIELQPGPTPAQQQQSIETEQNLETQSNEIPVEIPRPSNSHRSFSRPPSISRAPMIPMTMENPLLWMRAMWATDTRKNACAKASTRGWKAARYRPMFPIRRGASASGRVVHLPAWNNTHPKRDIIDFV